VVSSCTLIWWQISKEENLISASNYRVNQFIRVKEVRLIGANNENVGVVSVEEARRMAQEADLDLVEVAPNSEPPVCRIMDFGKFLYERTKKEREARKSQTKIEVKEIHLRPKTTAHHRSFKVRSARNWLEEGMKVIVRIRFKGREIDYVDLGLQDLKEVAEDLVDVAIVEKPPIMEGKSVLMVLAPSKPGKKKPQSQPQPNE
jgi:translation initiation factor IF-3